MMLLLGTCRCGGSGAVVSIDGSSTVYLISAAAAEDFQAQQGGQITVGRSGSGGGFEKLCQGEIEISGASRPIKPSEVALCSRHHVDYIELPIAYDGIAVVVNPQNTWVDSLAVDDLRRLWEPSAQAHVRLWQDVRPDWPAEEIHLFGPGVDSGTYDYFTKAVVGQEHASRGDYTSSEDDNVLVQGIASDRLALGYFGYAYFRANADRLRLIPIDDGNPSNGDGPIAPSQETVANGTYQPLARPIFIYVSRAAADRPEVTAFVGYYLAHAASLAAEVGYVPLPARAYELARDRFQRRATGSVFGGEGSQVGVSVESLLERE